MINSSTGGMTTIGTYSAKNAPSSVATTPNSQYLYVANQSSNDISQFSINASTGALTSVATAIATGSAPVHLVTSASGQYLYVLNQTAKTVSQFSISSSTGALTLVSLTAATVGNGATKIAQDPAGRFLYVTNTTDHTISAYSVNQTTGALTSVTGSPFSATVSGGQQPLAAKVDPSGQFLVVSWRAQSGITTFMIDQSTGAITEISGSSYTTGGEPRAIEILELKEQG
jgi:6-phosphogluconolactonase (cycloisomerase 2 family)